MYGWKRLSNKKKQIRITLTTICHQKSNNRNIHHISQIIVYTINFELPDTRSNLYIEKKKTIK